MDASSAPYPLTLLEPALTKEASYLACLNMMWRKGDGSRADDRYFLDSRMHFELKQRVRDSFFCLNFFLFVAVFTVQRTF